PRAVRVRDRFAARRPPGPNAAGGPVASLLSPRSLTACAHTLPAMRRWLLLLVAIAAVALAGLAITGCGGSTHSSQRASSGELVGAMFDGPVFAPGGDLDKQIELAVGSGVQSLRGAVGWGAFQPYRSLAE